MNCRWIAAGLAAGAAEHLRLPSIAEDSSPPLGRCTQERERKKARDKSEAAQAKLVSLTKGSKASNDV